MNDKETTLTSAHGENCTIERDLDVGGNLKVQQDAVFKGDLRVEGWFDAPNVLEANKGMFATVDDLKNTYKIPRNGWWALVGTTLPACIYQAQNGQWCDSEGVYEPEGVVFREYTDLVEQISQVRSGLTDALNSHSILIEAHDRDLIDVNDKVDGINLVLRRIISNALNGLSFQVCENEEEYEVIAAGSGIDPNRVYFILDE